MQEYAVYAGSFDPPTKGHVWMIEQASAMFDKLIVAVARNPEKTYTFDSKLRETWLKQVADKYANVEVATLENEFLSHYARDRGARFIVRGIRNEDDYQYERAMRYVNADLAPGLTTVFLMPPRGGTNRQHGLALHLGWTNPWQSSESVVAYQPGYGGLALYLNYRVRFGGLDR